MPANKMLAFCRKKYNKDSNSNNDEGRHISSWALYWEFELIFNECFCFLPSDLIHLSDNDAVPAGDSAAEMPSYECLHAVHLLLACIEDFIGGWKSACFGKPTDLAELTRLGFVLALSVKRFLGVNWFGVGLIQILFNLMFF